MALRRKDHPGERCTVTLPALILFLALCTVTSAVEFAGGTGEPNDPYQIATAQQLIAIGSDSVLPEKHFVLVASIDLAGPTWSSPVVSSFSGTFDGDGHTVRNLTAKGVGIQGLFGLIRSGAQVRNLGVIDADVLSSRSCGGLAQQNAGRVLNCYTTGTVTSTGDQTGGLVGRNIGTITGSYSTAAVMAHSNVGGLVGDNDLGTLSKCRGSGPVFGTMNVGGLVGTNRGSIASCYSDSDVMGGNALGGLVGSNSCGISYCYSTGCIMGEGGEGGLVGFNTAKILSSYSVATPIGPAAFIGGLAGTTSGISDGAKIDDCYFLALADGGRPDDTAGTPLTLAQMQQKSSYSGWGFWGTDPEGPWFMPADGCPVLTWQTEITGLQVVPDMTGLSPDQAPGVLARAGFILGHTTYDFCRALPKGFVIRAKPHSVAPVDGRVGLILSIGEAYDWAGNAGDGTAVDPYQIQTAGQLESLADHPELWDKCFILAADVDMTGRVYPAALIAPDANDAATGFQGPTFTGLFDGQGHSVRNLTIYTSGPDYVGLFGTVGHDGRVEGLHLLDATVTAKIGKKNVGILAGQNMGTLMDCLITGTISLGCDRVDGLVGLNSGTVADCYANVAVMRQCR